MINKSYVVIYGGGGHQEQMRKLLNWGLISPDDKADVIAMTDSKKPMNNRVIRTYTFTELRDKHSYLRTLFLLPLISIKLLYYSFFILLTHKVSGVVATGPGIAIIPCIIFRLFGKKTVIFESWSKFYQPSYTAKILYRFAGLFIVQHRSMLKVFPKAKYWGRL